MPDVHPIRLRGPWEMSLGETPGVAPQRVKLPARLVEVLGQTAVGRAQFVRRFGEPTAIEPHEKVWLVVETPHRLVAVRLNEQPLEMLSHGEETLRREAEITSGLNARNRLMLEVEFQSESQAEDGPLLGQVWLEIRSGC